MSDRYPFYAFVTDNPFRLCNAASATLLVELQEKAVRLQQRVRAGAEPEVGLAALFGAEEAVRCPEIVRTLDTDPERRELCRLFWPLSYADPTRPLATLEELRQCAEGDAVAEPQARFLAEWFRFLHAPDADALLGALSAFYSFRTAVTDDTPGLRTALEQVPEHLLASACRVAVERWQAGQYASALGLLKVVGVAPFSQQVIERGLHGIVALGEREVAALRELSDIGSRGIPEQALAPARNLLTLAETVGEHLPVTGLWKQAVEQYLTNVVGVMRRQVGMRVRDEGDFAAARAVLRTVLDEPLLAPWHARVQNDIAALDETEKSLLATDQPPVRHETEPPTTAPTARRSLREVLLHLPPWLPILVLCVAGIGAVLVNETYRAGSPCAASPFAPGCLTVEATPTPDGRQNVPALGTPDTAAATPGDERQNRLLGEQQALETELDRLNADLQKKHAGMDAERVQLVRTQKLLVKRGDSTDPDNNRAIRALNREIDQYNAERRVFNRRVKEYNLVLLALKEKYKRYQTVNTALDASATADAPPIDPPSLTFEGEALTL